MSESSREPQNTRRPQNARKPQKAREPQNTQEANDTCGPQDVRKPQNVYDDPAFFAGYSTLERFGGGWSTRQAAGRVGASTGTARKGPVRSGGSCRASARSTVCSPH